MLYKLASLRAMVCGAILSQIPITAGATDLQLGCHNFGRVYAPIVVQNTDDVTCPDGMVLRTLQVEQQLDRAWVSGSVARQFTPNRVVRRGPDKSPTREVGVAFQPHDAESLDVAFLFQGDFLLCEAFGFVELIAGEMSIAASGDVVNVAYDVDLFETQNDAVSITWGHRARQQNIQVGWLHARIQDDVFATSAIASTSATSGTLSFDFFAEVHLGDAP